MKLAGKRQRHIAARQGHRAVFERLPQHLQHVARELRQLVQEQHAVVRQADFARPRHSRAAADQAGVRYRVMRRAERPLRQQVRAPRGSKPATLWICVVSSASWKVERRQDAGEAFGQHRLARSRRPDHQHVVAAGRRHFQRPLGGGLAAHVAKVGNGMPAGSG